MTRGVWGEREERWLRERYAYEHAPQLVAEFEREQRRTETPAFISLGGALDRLGQRPGMEYQLRRHNCRAQQLSLPFHRSASPAHRYYLSYGAAAENMPTAC